MRKLVLSAIVLSALAAPALADGYPVSGAWGQSTTSTKGAIDCSGIRVINFNGNQRTDRQGGVPAFRNKWVSAAGASQYSVVNLFSTRQISNGTVSYTLRKIDDDISRWSHPAAR